jgi:hypothetical protein
LARNTAAHKAVSETLRISFCSGTGSIMFTSCVFAVYFYAQRQATSMLKKTSVAFPV